MEILTVLWISAVAALVAALWLNSLKKGDAAKVAGVVAAGLAVIAFTSGAGYIAPLAVTPTEPGVTLVPGVVDGTCQVKPYDKLTFKGDTWGANDATAPAGSVDIYAAGVDPSDASSTRFDTISVTAGVGNSTSGTAESCTNYGIVYNGASAEYDMWYNGLDWTQPNQFKPVSTTDATIANVLVQFDDIVVIASIPDPIEEHSTTGIINGQLTSNGSDGADLEIQIGTDSTPADSDVVYYNKSSANADLSYYLDVTLGADGANKQLHDPVLCFVNDHSNPFDGDEFTSVTLQRQSGTDFNLPTDITNYVNNADCVPMGTSINGGQTGVYRMQFTAVNANLDVTTDVMYIYPDDMGEYLGKDILKNTKATAGAVIEMQFE